MGDKKIKNVFIEGAIQPAFVADSISNHSAKKNIGAHSIFLGQVRNDLIENKEVMAIEYSAYHEMALEKFHQIREDTFASYSLTCLHIHHSLGIVKTGEISLFVFTSAVHRKEAIDACQYLVNRIKAEVPVWGKEIFDDESFVWKTN